jgi:hypothetical protein
MSDAQEETMGTYNDPRWWSDEHRSAWERVKAAFRRDWEQTKADVSSHGQDLNQNAGDTVKQAAGKQPIPPAHTPTRPDTEADWATVEHGYRYGFGARSVYEKDHQDWNDRLEAKLSEEWRDLKTGQTWDEVKTRVREGWDKARPFHGGPR